MCREATTGIRASSGMPIPAALPIQPWRGGLRSVLRTVLRLMTPLLQSGLQDFVQFVVPILQERGLFRHEYEGSTLRDHFGLRIPRNRFEKGR